MWPDHSFTAVAIKYSEKQWWHTLPGIVYKGWKLRRILTFGLECSHARNLVTSSQLEEKGQDGRNENSFKETRLKHSTGRCKVGTNDLLFSYRRDISSFTTG
jgi:hypothetical protein